MQPLKQINEWDNVTRQILVDCLAHVGAYWSLIKSKNLKKGMQ